MTADPGDAVKMVNVADGFRVRQEIDNMAWIDLGDCAVVVDALEHAEKEREVFDAIRADLGDKPIRYVINTHTHYDHTALNAAFERTFSAEILNHRTSGVGDEGRWLEGTTRRLQILHMPGCHTEEDWVVWVPADRALLVGDIFGWGVIPLTRPLRADTIDLLDKTLARLIDFDASVVIPGHGPVCTTAELRRWVDYLHWLIEVASRGCAEGKSDTEIRQTLGPPDDMKTWWRFLLWKHEDCVAKVLSAVRRGRLETRQ